MYSKRDARNRTRIFGSHLIGDGKGILAIGEFVVFGRKRFVVFDGGAMGNGVDQRVEVKGRQIRILRLDKHHVRRVVPKGRRG